MAAPNFLAGLVQGFSQARERSHDRDLIDEFKKSQKKLIDAQVDSLVATQEAKQRIAGLTRGQLYPTTTTGQTAAGPPQPIKPQSLIDILTNPQNAGDVIQAGIPISSIASLQQNQQMTDLFKRFMGGKGGQAGGAGDLSFSMGPNGLTINTIPPKLTTQTVDTGEGGPRIKVFATTSGGAREVADLGSAPKNMTSADAARLGLSFKAVKDIQNAIDTVAPIGLDGQRHVSKKIILEMSAPGGGVGIGRELRQKMETAVVGQLLIVSGVTARQEEKESLYDQFVPSLLDLTNKGLAVRKLENFQKLMQGNIDLQILPPTIQKRIQEKMQNPNKPKLPAGVPAGSKLIGNTVTGAPVYETKQGNRIVVEP